MAKNTAKEFSPVYTASREDGKQEIFRFSTGINEWIGPDNYSLTKRGGWNLKTSENERIPCLYVNGKAQCGPWTFTDLDIQYSNSQLRPVKERGSKRASTPRPDRRHQWRPSVPGVGACLTDLISNFAKIKPTAGCKCKSYSAKMDAWGPKGCEARREEIVEHLLSNQEILAEAIKDSKIPGTSLLSSLLGTRAAIPILKIGAGWLLTKAIANAELNLERQKTAYLHPSKAPDPFPFTGTPKLTLISHFYPRKGTWEYHVEKLVKVADQFDRKVMGIAFDEETEDLSIFKSHFPGWEFFEVPNNKKMREVATYKRLLKMVETNDPDSVTFCHHGKGSQDHTNSDEIRWWIDAMYETVLYNIPEVLQAMSDGASIVGSFRRLGTFLGTRNRWHFSGTYYAFRSARAYPSEAFSLRNKWWGTESWPGDYFPLNHSHCIFGDNAQDLYKEKYQPRQQFQDWLNTGKVEHNGI